MRRSFRTGALVAIIGLIRLARGVRSRWLLLLAGTILTGAGVVLRGGWGMVAIAGPWFGVYALFVPARSGLDGKRRDELEHELAAYSTLADRCDLEATLDRYSNDVTHDLRDILAGQAMAASSRQ